MSDVIKVEVENGMRTFQVGQGQPFAVDVAVAWNRWLEIVNADQRDIISKSNELLDDLGGGDEHNGAEAVAFVRTLQGLVDDLKKNIEPMPDDAESTGSTPSA